MDSGRIIDAFTSVANGLSLTPRPWAIRSRKRLALLDGESCPLILISVADDETFEPVGTARVPGELTYVVKRTVGMALVFDQQGKAGDNPGLRAWRDTLWPAFTFSTVSRVLPELNAIDPGGKPIFDGAAFMAGAFDWSVLSWTVETLEDRAV